MSALDQKPDMCGATQMSGHKQTQALQRGCPPYPDSYRESGHRQPVVSALRSKADMCGARSQVRYGPEADMRFTRSRRRRATAAPAER
jgi:hypothetical protein